MDTRAKSVRSGLLTVASRVDEVLAEVAAEHPLPEDARLLQSPPRGPRGDEAPAARHQDPCHHTASSEGRHPHVITERRHHRGTPITAGEASAQTRQRHSNIN